MDVTHVSHFQSQSSSLERVGASAVESAGVHQLQQLRPEMLTHTEAQHAKVVDPLLSVVKPCGALPLFPPIRTTPQTLPSGYSMHPSGHVNL